MQIKLQPLQLVNVYQQAINQFMRGRAWTPNDTTRALREACSHTYLSNTPNGRKPCPPVTIEVSAFGGIQASESVQAGQSGQPQPMPPQPQAQGPQPPNPAAPQKPVAPAGEASQTALIAFIDELQTMAGLPEGSPERDQAEQRADMLWEMIRNGDDDGEGQGEEDDNGEQTAALKEALSRVPFDVFTHVYHLDNGPWQPFKGPRGGIGWKNSQTGRVLYTNATEAPGSRRRTQQASGERAKVIGDRVMSHYQNPEEHHAPDENELQELATHLPKMTAQHLQQLRGRLMASFKHGKRQSQMVEALKAHVDHLVKNKQEHGALFPEAKKGAAIADAKEEAQAAKSPKPGTVKMLSTDEMHVDPERFQFKMNTNKEGVTDELKGVQTFNPDLAGIISVWHDPKDGKTFVVNGHHRAELAKRTGHPHLAVRYINAPNATEARAKGALINIAEGRGTAVDAAKFMRDMDLKPEDLATHGISLKGALARDAGHLRGLADPLFAKVARGQMDTDRAVAIGKHLNGKEDLQLQLANFIDRKEEQTGREWTPKMVAEAAEEVAHAPTTTKDDGGLFGGTTEESRLEERAALKSHVRGELAKAQRDFEAVASDRRAGAVKEAGNVLNVEENKKHAVQHAQDAEVFAKLAHYKGPMSDLINQAAEEYANVPKSKRRQIETNLVGQVRDLIHRGGATGTGDQGGGVVSEGSAGATGTGALPTERGELPIGEGSTTEGDNPNVDGANNGSEPQQQGEQTATDQSEGSASAEARQEGQATHPTRKYLEGVTAKLSDPTLSMDEKLKHAGDTDTHFLDPLLKAEPEAIINNELFRSLWHDHKEAKGDGVSLAHLKDVSLATTHKRMQRLVGAIRHLAEQGKQVNDYQGQPIDLHALADHYEQMAPKLSDEIYQVGVKTHEGKPDVTHLDLDQMHEAKNVAAHVGVSEEQLAARAKELGVSRMRDGSRIIYRGAGLKKLVESFKGATPKEEPKATATDWKDTAAQYRHGGSATAGEAAHLTHTYDGLGEADRKEFAHHFGIDNAHKALPETRDELVGRKIRELEFRGAKEVPDVHDGNLFTERGVGEKRSLFDDDGQAADAGLVNDSETTPEATPTTDVRSAADGKPTAAESKEDLTDKAVDYTDKTVKLNPSPTTEDSVVNQENALETPTDGLGIPDGVTFVGENKKGKPIFLKDGKYHSRGEKGQGTMEISGGQFDPSKIVRPSVGEAQQRTAKEKEQAAADTKASEAKQTQEERLQQELEAAKKRGEQRAAEQAQRQQEQTERDNQFRQEKAQRQTTANHLDFHDNSSDPHRVEEGVADGKVRLTAGPEKLGKQYGKTKWKSGYVAKINGVGGQYGMEREFVTEKGGGSPVTTDVGDGVYEVGSAGNKHYVHVENGKPKVVSADAVEGLVGVSPQEKENRAKQQTANERRTTNRQRPTTGPAREYSFDDNDHDHIQGKPQVGDIILVNDVPHRIESVGKSHHISAELREDMDDFGHPGGWETETTIAPVDWQDGDPETKGKAKERKEREATERKEKFEAHLAHAEPVSTWPKDRLFSGGGDDSRFWETKAVPVKDRPGYYQHQGPYPLPMTYFRETADGKLAELPTFDPKAPKVEPKKKDTDEPPSDGQGGIPPKTPTPQTPTGGAGDLPKLTGSDKQKKWAEDIRREALDHTTYHKTLSPIAEKMLPIIGGAADKVTDSEEWIKHKNAPDALLFRKHFGLEDNHVYNQISDRINYNLAMERRGKKTKNHIDGDEAESLAQYAGSEAKAKQIAEAFGFTYGTDPEPPDANPDPKTPPAADGPTTPTVEADPTPTSATTPEGQQATVTDQSPAPPKRKATKASDTLQEPKPLSKAAAKSYATQLHHHWQQHQAGDAAHGKHYADALANLQQLPAADQDAVFAHADKLSGVNHRQPVTPDAKAEAKPAKTWDEGNDKHVAELLDRAYGHRRMFAENRDGLVEVPLLYHEMKKHMPDLSVARFHQELRKYQQHGNGGELHVLNEVHSAVDPHLALQGGDASDPRLYYYLRQHHNDGDILAPDAKPER